MDYELHKLTAQAAVLKDVLDDYPTATIACALKQIESRIKEIKNQHGS